MFTTLLRLNFFLDLNEIEKRSTFEYFFHVVSSTVKKGKATGHLFKENLFVYIIFPCFWTQEFLFQEFI